MDIKNFILIKKKFIFKNKCNSFIKELKDKVKPGLVEGIFNSVWGKAKEIAGEIIPHSKQLVIQPEVSEPAPAPAPAIPGMTGPPGRDYSSANYSDDPVDYPSDYDYGGWY